ncbi:helix-turn-helix domain-containing protein [Azotobacter salinestris]|uniref:helix-turn-helix domain-containing protein n=1 Tax=Azotobacter salinestris TaxID=69964 RepID=UPI0032DF3A7C
MKRNQALSMAEPLQAQLKSLGQSLARARIARRVTQAELAARANISRNTVTRLEAGDAGVAIGQILRYLDALRPGVTLQAFFCDEDLAVTAMEAQAVRKRARPLSEKELADFDF